VEVDPSPNSQLEHGPMPDRSEINRPSENPASEVVPNNDSAQISKTREQIDAAGRPPSNKIPTITAGKIQINYSGLYSNRLSWNTEHLTNVSNSFDLVSRISVRHGKDVLPRGGAYISLGETAAKGGWNTIDKKSGSKAGAKAIEVKPDFGQNKIEIIIHDQIIREISREKTDVDPMDAFVSTLKPEVGSALLDAAWAEKKYQLKVGATMLATAIGSEAFFLWGLSHQIPAAKLAAERGALLLIDANASILQTVLSIASVPLLLKFGLPYIRSLFHLPEEYFSTPSQILLYKPLRSMAKGYLELKKKEFLSVMPK
jgi:hypothetical protein